MLDTPELPGAGWWGGYGAALPATEASACHAAIAITAHQASVASPPIASDTSAPRSRQLGGNVPSWTVNVPPLSIIAAIPCFTPLPSQFPFHLNFGVSKAVNLRGRALADLAATRSPAADALR